MNNSLSLKFVRCTITSSFLGPLQVNWRGVTVVKRVLKDSKHTDVCSFYVSMTHTLPEIRLKKFSREMWYKLLTWIPYVLIIICIMENIVCSMNIHQQPDKRKLLTFIRCKKQKNGNEIHTILLNNSAKIIKLKKIKIIFKIQKRGKSINFTSIKKILNIPPFIVMNFKIFAYHFDYN